jgi:hypothetical protein
MTIRDWQPTAPKEQVDYEVGKYRPPKHTRFQKGKSGNPHGRRKKPVHVGTTMDGLLNQQVSVLVDGKKVKMTGIEALLRKSFAEALKGDHRMLKMFLEFAKLRTDATANFEEARRDDAGLNDKIDDLLARIELDKANKAKAEAEALARKNGVAPPA